MSYSRATDLFTKVAGCILAAQDFLTGTRGGYARELATNTGGWIKCNHSWEYYPLTKSESYELVGTVWYSYIFSHHRRTCDRCGERQYYIHPFLLIGNWKRAADLPVAKVIKI